MKLRRKLLLFFGLVFICLIVIEYSISQIIFMNSFVAYEEQDTIQNIERVNSAVVLELSNLDAYVYDWAAWDDTYSFIQDLNEDYIDSNLVDGTFITSELNFMLFVNSSGDIAFSKAFDLDNEEEIPVPESLLKHLSSDSILLKHPKTSDGVKGILLLPEDPVLIVSRPIIKSNDEGPILGSLIMGYYYDSSRLDRLTEITHLPIMLQRFDATEMPDGFKEALSFFSTESSIFVTPLNSDFIVGYTLLEDVYGDPSVVFRIDLPRTIYKQGLASTTYFSLFLITTGITFGTLFIVILERTMLSRLAQLNNDVNLIQLHGDPSKRVKVAGKDELSNLATEINDMLSSLEKSQNKLRLINEKLGVVGSLTRHDARNKLAVIENNVYLAKQKLSGDLNVHDNLSEIETASERICKLFDFAKTYENIGAEELSSIHVEKSVKEAAMILGLGNVKLLLDCPDLIVKADSLVRQLFYNLIDNSLKHGENISKIKVYCDEMEGQTKIVYEDDGIGIPVHEKEKIFEKGYGKGTGYGLYLIKKICEAYGWTIKETGKYGKGARFIITIQKANN